MVKYPGMRQLWFGGSFNPIHNGHLICARAVAESAGFDRVVLVPSRQPPHKTGDTSLANAERRLKMCLLATANDPFFAIEELELTREGPSYTIHSARELKARGEKQITWLIGADMANLLPRWHEPAGLMAEIQFLLMARPGWIFDWSALPGDMQKLRSSVVTAPLVEISSTSIRDRVAKGQSIRYLTTDPVVDYIQREGLYRKS